MCELGRKEAACGIITCAGSMSLLPRSISRCDVPCEEKRIPGIRIHQYSGYVIIVDSLPASGSQNANTSHRLRDTGQVMDGMRENVALEQDTTT